MLVAQIQMREFGGDFMHKRPATLEEEVGASNSSDSDESL